MKQKTTIEEELNFIGNMVNDVKLCIDKNSTAEDFNIIHEDLKKISNELDDISGFLLLLAGLKYVELRYGEIDNETILLAKVQRGMRLLNDRKERFEDE